MEKPNTTAQAVLMYTEACSGFWGVLVPVVASASAKWLRNVVYKYSWYSSVHLITHPQFAKICGDTNTNQWLRPTFCTVYTRT